MNSLPNRDRIAGPPPLPLGASRQARVHNLHLWYESMTESGLDPDDAALRAIEAAIPADAEKLPLGSRVILWVIALIFAAAVIPALIWIIGNVLIPWVKVCVAWLL
jgi:hypothetical protein